MKASTERPGAAVRRTDLPEERCQRFEMKKDLGKKRMTEDFPAEAECTDEGEQNAELNKTARNRKTIAVQPFSERAGRVR